MNECFRFANNSTVKSAAVPPIPEKFHVLIQTILSCFSNDFLGVSSGFNTTFEKKMCVVKIIIENMTSVCQCRRRHLAAMAVQELCD